MPKNTLIAATMTKASTALMPLLINRAQITPARDITPPTERLIPPVMMIAVIITAGMAV